MSNYPDDKSASVLYHRHVKPIKKARREIADHDFPSAQRRCRSIGLTLMKHNETHYTLRRDPGGFLLSIYPGNKRLFHDPNRAKLPFIQVPEDWCLEDVITAVIDTYLGGQK
jgi:hypothetical protein